VRRLAGATFDHIQIKTNVNLAEEGIVAPEMLLKQYGGELEVR
jgi:hypothetical protein